MSPCFFFDCAWKCDRGRDRRIGRMRTMRVCAIPISQRGEARVLFKRLQSRTKDKNGEEKERKRRGKEEKKRKRTGNVALASRRRIG